MGYACPVCEAPQADGEHLANHLAFTAMLHDDAHAAFLDDHVEGWEDKTPGLLGAEVVRFADWTDVETVFDDTTEGPGMGGGSTGASPAGTDDSAGGTDGLIPDVSGLEPADDAGFDLDALADDDTLDAETRRVVEEARKLLERGDEAGDAGDDAA